MAEGPFRNTRSSVEMPQGQTSLKVGSQISILETPSKKSPRRKKIKPLEKEKDSSVKTQKIRTPSGQVLSTSVGDIRNFFSSDVKGINFDEWSGKALSAPEQNDQRKFTVTQKSNQSNSQQARQRLNMREGNRDDVHNGQWPSRLTQTELNSNCNSKQKQEVAKDKRYKGDKQQKAKSVNISQFEEELEQLLQQWLEVQSDDESEQDNERNKCENMVLMNRMMRMRGLRKQGTKEDVLLSTLYYMPSTFQRKVVCFFHDSKE